MNQHLAQQQDDPVSAQTEALRIAVEYLDSNRLNKIASGSTCHLKMRAALDADNRPLRSQGAETAPAKGDPLSWWKEHLSVHLAILFRASGMSPEEAERSAAQVVRDAEPLAPRPMPAPPFLHSIVAKLRRFEECAEDFDCDGVDIGRDWLDLLTKLGLLARVQRSPGLWEMTEEGSEALASLGHL